MLGPFEVRTDDGVFADVPGARLRGLLIALALEPGHRLAEAGESDLARHAHLAYFTELAETAEPHLRRAEQLEWLATLEVEHDNIGSAMRGALAAGEAHAAMRLAAGAGGYWWLSGHKAEGNELITAATVIPGEVADEIRAMVYALITMFVNSGPGDEHQAAEWIHKAYRFSQRGRSRNPLLGLVVPLERMLQAPDAFLPAWEPLLDNEDPWVRVEPVRTRAAASSTTTSENRSRTWLPGTWRLSSSGVPSATRWPWSSTAIRSAS